MRRAFGLRLYPSTSSISPRMERMSVASSLRSAIASAV